MNEREQAVEPLVVPTNVVILVNRVGPGSKYQYGDTDTGANVDAYTSGNGQRLVNNGSIADSTLTTPAVQAALANGAYRQQMLLVDRKNRGAPTETLS
jgi:hypothetical protein